MLRLLRRLPSLTLLVATSGQFQSMSVWQADIQIRTLEVTRNRNSINLRVVVYTENDDDAQHARLLILLPVGVGIEKLAPKCDAIPGPSMVPSLRATVACELGAIPNRGFHEVMMRTTVPTTAHPNRFGVFTYSGTPDPVPGNNYAERVIP
jgi:hypothetical protein